MTCVCVEAEEPGAVAVEEDEREQPDAAPTESRLSRTETSAITIERNATVRRMKLRLSTKRMTYGVAPLTASK